MTTAARPVGTSQVLDSLRRTSRATVAQLPRGLGWLASRALLRVLAALAIVGIALVLLSFCHGTSRPDELARLAILVMTLDAFLSWLFMYRHRYRRPRSKARPA